jgi:phosphopantothenoylcysteine decarboxylase/phosphopantothenate--cysteine ligase
VGFALEAGEGVTRARQKLERKQLDLIVLNRAEEPGSGFEQETNRVALITAGEVQELEMMSKSEVAERILDAIEPLL